MSRALWWELEEPKGPKGVAAHDRPDGVPKVAQLQGRVSRDREALLAGATALAESTLGLSCPSDDTRHRFRRCEPGIHEGMALYSHPFRWCFSWEENAGTLFGTHPLGDWVGKGRLLELQGYLTYKTTQPPRTLP